VLVRRNDELTLADIAAGAAKIVISPGPCTPDESGFRWRLSAIMPANADLGVCLGHQAIAQVLAPLSCERPK
jgi:para-aminobenzoate synthetase component 2